LGTDLLKLSLERNALEIADLLVGHGAVPDGLQGALHDAAFAGNRGTIDWLLKHGIAIDRCGGRGQPAILSAAGNGQHGTVAHLLALGADAHARDENGNGLLHHAAPWPRCLEVILPTMPEIDRANAAGQTPLQCAAQAAEPASVGLLLKAGANPGLQDSKGNTALHLIFAGGELRPDLEFPVFLALVEAGASLSHRNRDGQTPYDLAVRHEYPEEYLRARLKTHLAWLNAASKLTNFGIAI
jgi:ankyrin repeat protein